MSKEFKDYVQVIFEIVMILASLGLCVALIKKVYTYIKEKLLFFVNVDKRLKALENKKRRKSKTNKK